MGFAGELGGGDLASIFQTILTGGIKDKHLPGEVRGTLTTELGEASKAFGEAFGSK